MDDSAAERTPGTRKRSRISPGTPDAAFQRLLDRLPAGAYTCDAAGLITYFNARAVEVWGREPKLHDTEDRFCGSFKLYAADGQPLRHDQCWMALALQHQREYLGCEIVVERPDGQRRRVLAHATPLRDGGRPTGAVNVLVDVTDLRRTEDRLRMLLESIDDHFVQYDHQWRYTFVTEKGAAMIGKTPQELLGKSIWELFPDAIGNPYYVHLHEAVKTRRVIRFEHHYAPFGRWFDNHIYPTDDGVTVFATDITQRKAAEEARSQLAAIIESSSDAIIGKNLDGVITSWNAGAERLYGYASGEIVGQSITRLIPPDRLDEEAEIIARIRRGERLENYETVRCHRNGQPIDVSVTTSPVRDGTGTIIGASTVAHDISERKKNEREIRVREERYRSLVHASGAIVFTSDAQANWHEPQPSWEAYTGQAFEEYRGHGWASAIHPDDRARIQASVAAAIARGSTWQEEGRLWHAASRTYRYQEARAVPIRGADGTVREWVGTCLDIHARKMAEQAVREADRRKDEFLAVLAHELRNPLAPISTGMQILRLPGGDAARESALDIMERQVHHLVRLVDDLLEVSRITRGTIELRKETFPLQEAVRAAIEISRDLVDAHGHALTVDLPPEPLRVTGDRVRLTQIVANLLNNAAKYTPRGGKIKIAASQRHDEARVCVSDSGVGIEPHLMDRVFEMFGQTGRSIERFAGGLGIGLSLARRLAELHGGTVEGASDGDGKGSTFTVRLPLAPRAQAGRAAPEPPAELDAPPRRVLVVDDNRDAAATLATLLQTLGHEVTAAHDGDEALRVAESLRPDVVLLDLGMPSLSGYDVARRLRETPWGARARLVAVTGWSQQADRRRTLESGFDMHLVKPVALPDVRRALGG